MDESKSTSEWKAVHYLILVSTICYGCLVLFLKLKGNFSTNWTWPLIRTGCKWSLFSWMVYGGFVYGKLLANKAIRPLEENLKNVEEKLRKAKLESEALQNHLKETKAALLKEQQESRRLENHLLETVKKYERTAEDVTRLALKNFL